MMQFFYQLTFHNFIFSDRNFYSKHHEKEKEKAQSPSHDLRTDFQDGTQCMATFNQGQTADGIRIKAALPATV